MLMQAAQHLGNVPDYYSLWPGSSVSGEPWRTLAAAVYNSLQDLPVLHTNASGGRWLNPTEAVFATGVEARSVCASFACHHA